MLKRTPLYHEHEKLHARFTEFGGWDMPVQYTSIIDEHNVVRRHAGIFDTSHMGTFVISGAGAARFLDMMTTGNMTNLIPGKARYTLFLNQRGGIIDDLIVYRRENDFLAVVNAGNIEKDFAWLNHHKPDDVVLEDISPKICLIALQGPDSEGILQELVTSPLREAMYFTSIKPIFKEMRPSFALFARTGYTGEDGFELLVSNETAGAVWEKLLALGAKACGLGCRDTLRLEACMPLHGHEITEDITPIEAELGWCIFWEKDFIGKEALLTQKQRGLTRFLTAFITDSGIPRAGCDITGPDALAGSTTSGTFSPTLKKGIGLGYLNRPSAAGDKITVVIHQQPKAATVVPRPFYKRQR